MEIEKFPRLGKVLGQHNYAQNWPGDNYGWTSSGIEAMKRWLTLPEPTLYTEPFPIGGDKFLFNVNFGGDVVNEDLTHRLRPVDTSGMDFIIAHFINRRICHPSPQVFRQMFARKFQQVKPQYETAYKLWSGLYEKATAPSYFPANVPIFSSYFREHQEELSGIITADRAGSVVANGGGTNTGTVKDVISTTTTSDTNDVTTNDTQSVTVVDRESGGNGRRLSSDTPQSNVSASTTGNPTDITWKYASGLEDTINKTTEDGTDTQTNTGTVTVDRGGESITTGDTTRTLNTANTTESTVDTTDDTHTVSDQDNHRTETEYKSPVDTVNAFLGSPFATYFWEKLFGEFEQFFLPIYDMENQPLYTWRIDRETPYPENVGVGIQAIRWEE